MCRLIDFEETDIEEFEDNPEEYIRKDIEKSGSLLFDKIKWFIDAGNRTIVYRFRFSDTTSSCLRFPAIFVHFLRTTSHLDLQSIHRHVTKSMSTKHFLSRLIDIVNVCLFHLSIQEYQQNPVQNWPKKDACIFLVLALASKGETQKVRWSNIHFDWIVLRKQTNDFSSE